MDFLVYDFFYFNKHFMVIQIYIISLTFVTYFKNGDKLKIMMVQCGLCNYCDYCNDKYS